MEYIALVWQVIWQVIALIWSGLYKYFSIWPNFFDMDMSEAFFTVWMCGLASGLMMLLISKAISRLKGKDKEENPPTVPYELVDIWLSRNSWFVSIYHKTYNIFPHDTCEVLPRIAALAAFWFFSSATIILLGSALLGLVIYLLTIIAIGVAAVLTNPTVVAKVAQGFVFFVFGLTGWVVADIANYVWSLLTTPTALKALIFAAALALIVLFLKSEVGQLTKLTIKGYAKHFCFRIGIV